MVLPQNNADCQALVGLLLLLKLLSDSYVVMILACFVKSLHLKTNIDIWLALCLAAVNIGTLHTTYPCRSKWFQVIICHCNLMLLILNEIRHVNWEEKKELIMSHCWLMIGGGWIGNRLSLDWPIMTARPPYRASAQTAQKTPLPTALLLLRVCLLRPLLEGCWAIA
jgi:hypothetical protein